MQSLKTELPGNPKRKECLTFRQRTLDPTQPKPFRFAAHRTTQADMGRPGRKASASVAEASTPNKYSELTDKQLAAHFRTSWPYRKAKTSKITYNQSQWLMPVFKQV